MSPGHVEIHGLKFNLSAVERPFGYQWSIDALKDRDGAGFAESGYSNGAALALVFDNLRSLKSLGIYEASLLAAFTGCKRNHRRWDTRVIELLFSEADRDKLRAAGTPFDIGATFTVYRGVSGMGRARRIDGFSWSSNLDRACWFATRFHLPYPAIYSAQVPGSEIFCHYRNRDEDEFICRPKNRVRLRLTKEEIAIGSERTIEAIKAGDAASMAALKARHAQSVTSSAAK